LIGASQPAFSNNKLHLNYQDFKCKAVYSLLICSKIRQKTQSMPVCIASIFNAILGQISENKPNSRGEITATPRSGCGALCFFQPAPTLHLPPAAREGKKH